MPPKRKKATKAAPKEEVKEVEVAAAEQDDGFDFAEPVRIYNLSALPSMFFFCFI